MNFLHHKPIKVFLRELADVPLNYHFDVTIPKATFWTLVLLGATDVNIFSRAVVHPLPA